MQNESKCKKARKLTLFVELIRGQIENYVRTRLPPFPNEFELMIVHIFLHCSCISLDVPYHERRTHTRGDQYQFYFYV